MTLQEIIDFAKAQQAKRNEKRRLAFDYRGDPQAEYLQFFRLGVDGVFTDLPDTAVTARATLLREARR